MILDFALGLLFSLAIFLALFFSKQRTLAFIWALRSVVTLGLVTYFESTQGFDGPSYFSHAMAGEYRGLIPSFSEMERNFPWLSSFLIEVLGFSYSYQALKVLFSLIGFVGTLLLAQVLADATKISFRHLALALNLIPSVLYWTSTFGKDPVVFLGIQLVFYGLWRSNRPLGIFGWLLAAFFRPWIAVALALGFFSTRRGWLRWGGIAAMLLGAYFFTWHRFHMADLSEVVSLVNIISHAWNRGTTATAIPEFLSLRDILIYWPHGLLTALFRPLPFWDSLPGLSIVFGFESVAWILGIFLALFHKLKDGGKPKSGISTLTLFCLVYFVSWAMFYAFVSPQNLITGVRFKLGVLGVFLYLVLKSKRHLPSESQPAKLPWL